MSRGYGRYLIALGGLGALIAGSACIGWTYLGPRNPNVAPYDATERPEQASHAKGGRCDPARIRKLPDVAQREDEKSRCAEEEETYKASQQSLELSRRAANASEQALLITNYQAATSFWQAFAALWGAVVTLLALHYAKRAADTAAKAIDDFERPWLVLEGVRFDHGHSGPYIELGIRNVGRSPALLNGVEAKIIPKESATRSPQYEGMIHLSCAGIIPQDKTEMVQKFGGIAFGSRQKPIESVVFGRIRYRHLSGGNYETGFALSVFPPMAVPYAEGEGYDYHT